MLAFSTCFAHPTVMMRKDIIVKNKLQYDYDYKNAEDYCMWINMISLGNLPTWMRR